MDGIAPIAKRIGGRRMNEVAILLVICIVIWGSLAWFLYE
jgi:hypothetical protein